MGGISSPFSCRRNAAEQPRVAQGSPAHHQAVTTGGLHHGQGVLGRGKVAVAQHRNGHRLLHRRDHREVNARLVHLLPGAGVHDHGRGPRRLTGLGHLYGGAVGLVPPGPHFYGDGAAAAVFHHGLHDAPGEGGSSISLLPAPEETIFGAGQPMLMS